MTASPPTTPPTIAPIGVDFDGVGVGLGGGVGDGEGVGVGVEELELIGLEILDFDDVDDSGTVVRARLSCPT